MRESALSRQTRDYLQILANQGYLWFTRLQAGSLIVAQGDKRYKLNLCPAGTADWLILTQYQIIFWETKSSQGELSPAQKEFRDIVTKHGAYYRYGKTLNPLIRILKIWNPNIPIPEDLK